MPSALPARYASMLRMPRPVSRRHLPMSTGDRAKIFSPFAALKGFEESIESRTLISVPRRVLSDEMKSAIDQTLRSLRRGDMVRITYFVPGADGMLGEYRTETGLAAKICPELDYIQVVSTRISLSSIDSLRLLSRKEH